MFLLRVLIESGRTCTQSFCRSCVRIDRDRKKGPAWNTPWRWYKDFSGEGGWCSSNLGRAQPLLGRKITAAAASDTSNWSASGGISHQHNVFDAGRSKDRFTFDVRRFTNKLVAFAIWSRRGVLLWILMYQLRCKIVIDKYYNTM
jgi:hypothetical protein